MAVKLDGVSVNTKGGLGRHRCRLATGGDRHAIMKSDRCSWHGVGVALRAVQPHANAKIETETKAMD